MYSSLESASTKYGVMPHRVERGAVLLHTGRAVECLYFNWEQKFLNRVKSQVGDPAWQGIWELVTLLLSLMVWGQHAVTKFVTFRGDNIAALADALQWRGRGYLNAVARELAWRNVRFVLTHLPSEQSGLDALSRMTAVPPHEFPEVLMSCAQRHQTCTTCGKLGWQLTLPRDPSG